MVVVLPPGFPASRTAENVISKLSSSSLWKQIPIKDLTSTRDFLHGTTLDNRSKVIYTFFLNIEQRCIQGLVHFGTHTEGPKGYVHGGASAAVLDASMGILSWRSGIPSVTGELTVRYRNMLPTGTTLLVKSWIEKDEGRKLILRSTLTDIENTTYSETSDLSRGLLFVEAEAIFIRIKKIP